MTKPTPEQLEAVAAAIVAANDEGPAAAQAAWDVIAPLVRAQALEGVESVASECAAESCRCEERIRALMKDKL